MTGLEPTGFAEFDRLALLFRHARALFDALLQTGDLPAGGTEMLATETLPHIEDVEAGFLVRLRANEAGLDELRALVRQTGLGLPQPIDDAEHRAALIEAMQAISGAGGERELVPPSPRGIAAMEHARLAFAMLPRTEPEDVHFPGMVRSYADITTPRTPTEFMRRVEEIERTLWWVAAGDRPARSDRAYRRVYGFFDAGERLTGKGLRFD